MLFRSTLARDIDPVYGRAFDRAREAGVEALAYVCRVEANEITLGASVPILP